MKLEFDDIFEMSELHKAAMDGDLALMRHLLDSGVDIEERNWA